jgi:uncharacterized protein YodC (DUF2158 family)
MFMSNNPPIQRMVFFNVGDSVRVKIPNAPVMLVQKIVKNPDAKSSRDRLLGIECMWFEGDALREKLFNTKDLEHVAAVAHVAEVGPHTWGEEAE